MVFTGSAIVATIAELGWVQAIFTFLSGIFVTVLGWLASKMAVRFALAIASIGLTLGIALSLFLVMKAAMSGIFVATPDYVQNGINCVIPDNFVPCLSAILGLRIAMQVYRFKSDFITRLYIG